MLTLIRVKEALLFVQDLETDSIVHFCCFNGDCCLGIPAPSQKMRSFFWYPVVEDSDLMKGLASLFVLEKTISRDGTVLSCLQGLQPQILGWLRVLAASLEESMQ